MSSFIRLFAVFCFVASLIVAGQSAIAQEKSRGATKKQPGNGKQANAKSEPAANKKKKKKPAPFKWVNRSDKASDTLRHCTFRSPSLEVDIGYYVLLPPDYEKNAKTKYPVVYYLHGGRPGSEAKSISIGATAHELMEAGKVAQAIYVFPNGGPVSHYNIPDDPKKQGADVFIKELIPHVDRTYRTIADRKGRAIEGFSQGGRATMRLSLRYPELFCSAAAGGGGYETEKRISEEDGYENPNLRFGKGDNTWDLARAYQRRSDAPMVRWMIYVGKEGFNYKNNIEYMRFLDSLGIKYETVIHPTAGHSARDIYKTNARQIMQFHAANFVKAATMNVYDNQLQIDAQIE